MTADYADGTDEERGNLRFRIIRVIRAIRGSNSFLDRDLRLHRVRNETLGVGEVMHLVELLLGRLFVARKRDLRMELGPGDRHLPVFVLLHVADRFIRVFVDDELLFAGHRQEREHMATGERRHERFFRVGVRRVPQIRRRRRGRHLVPAVEFPSVIARVLLILERLIAALPVERNFVFGHAF